MHSRSLLFVGGGRVVLRGGRGSLAGRGGGGGGGGYLPAENWSAPVSMNSTKNIIQAIKNEPNLCMCMPSRRIVCVAQHALFIGAYS